MPIAIRNICITDSECITGPNSDLQNTILNGHVTIMTSSSDWTVKTKQSSGLLISLELQLKLEVLVRDTLAIALTIRPEVLTRVSQPTILENYLSVFSLINGAL